MFANSSFGKSEGYASDMVVLNNQIKHSVS